MVSSHALYQIYNRMYLSGSGFVASHVVLEFLHHGHQVVTTVRSQPKGEALCRVIPADLASLLTYSIVENISIPHALDTVGRYFHVGSHLIFILIFYHGYHERYYQRTPLTLLFTQRQPINFKTSAFVVVHYQHISERRILSSPFSKSPGDLLDPAVNGTKSLLNSIKRLAPSVKRLVVTSSHAALIDFSMQHRPGYVYTAEDWNPASAIPFPAVY